MSASPEQALVELGSRAIDARLRAKAARQDVKRATREWWDVAKQLAATPGIAELSADVQEECFRQSCALIGVDPMAPELADERAAFARKRRAEQEACLVAQFACADWN